MKFCLVPSFYILHWCFLRLQLFLSCTVKALMAFSLQYDYWRICLPPSWIANSLRAWAVPYSLTFVSPVGPGPGLCMQSTLKHWLSRQMHEGQGF